MAALKRSCTAACTMDTWQCCQRVQHGGNSRQQPWASLPHLSSRIALEAAGKLSFLATPQARAPLQLGKCLANNGGAPSQHCGATQACALVTDPAAQGCSHGCPASLLGKPVSQGVEQHQPIYGTPHNHEVVSVAVNV